MSRKYINTSSPESVWENITTQVYMTDHMKELVGTYYRLSYIECCIQGHDVSFSPSLCTCVKNKPYVKVEKFTAYCLCPGAEDKAVKIPRWKALEILNDWNLASSREAMKANRQPRWVYSL